MSEEGVECVTKNKNQLITCVKKAVPEFFAPKYHRRKNINELHFYIFQQENCRKGDAIIDCVEKSLLKCDDPTPSNLLHGLLKSMRDVTPCTTSSGFSINISIIYRIVPSLLLLLSTLLFSQSKGL